jgi:hypothetical protein
MAPYKRANAPSVSRRLALRAISSQADHAVAAEEERKETGRCKGDDPVAQARGPNPSK